MELFGKDAFSPFFTVESVYRVPARLPQPGSFPRSMLAKLHYRDQDAVLHQAWGHTNLFNGARVSFWPDISAEVKKCRATFTDVKRHLRLQQLNYTMLYPVKLWVTVKGQAQFFESAKEASAWLDRNEQALQH